MSFPTFCGSISSTSVSCRIFSVQVIFILILIGTSNGSINSCDATTKSQSSRQANFCTLKLVQVIMRHGDRNPLADYPNNPYKDVDKHWPGGYGQLSQVGEEQTCELGSFLRGRYDGFLPRDYHVDEMMAWSSYTDRSIRSAVAALRGLYPRQHTHDDLDAEIESCLYRPAQIVPLRTIPKEEDNLIYMHRKCAVYDAEFKRFLNESQVESQFRRGQAIVEIIAREAGVKKDGNLMRTIGMIFDSLLVQKHQGKERPSWLTTEMEEYAEKIFISVMQAASGNPLLRKFMSGIVEKILENMEELIHAEADEDNVAKGPSEEFESYSKGKRRQRRLIIFSGHDKTIITFLNLLNIFNGVRPPYSSAVIVELHKIPQHEDYHLEIFYRNDTKSPVHPLTIPECAIEGHCFLKRFKEITVPMFPKDYVAECQEKIPASLDATNSSSHECFSKTAKTTFSSFHWISSFFETLSTFTHTCLDNFL